MAEEEAQETTNSHILLTPISEEMERGFLDYAMSVIVARALPDVRDGLKPVHRRILYAMHQLGLGGSASHSKSAKVVGEVLGKYHPHGDIPVYEALVRMAQDFSMRYPLVDGQGNFGSVDGDPPAAMRYTEARLSKISAPLLADIEKETVDFVDNFDATLKEPSFLPALLPNLLLMGSEGIAVGMATKIPPHNLKEVVEGIAKVIDAGKVVADEKATKDTDTILERIDKIAAGQAANLTQEEVNPSNISFESAATVEDLVKIIPGPDFPTGGAIYGGKNMTDVYTTGRGRILVRGIANIEEGARGKSVIIISELPYQVNKATLVKKIADLVKDKKISGISDLRDESDKDGMRVVIELKKAGKPKSVLNNLYKQTQLQNAFSANFVALVDGTPHTIGLKQILVEYVKHRQRVIVRRTIFELTSAKRRAHILEGLKIALDNLDEVIKTIRASRTQEIAKEALISKFKLSEIQATAILDMQLRRLAALEREKIEKEYAEIKKLIDQLIAILRNPEKVLGIIKKETSEVSEKFGDTRRTKIYQQEVGEFSEQDLVAKEDTIITITKTGYIKRVPRGTYRVQARGGKGVVGMTTKEEDEIEHIVSATTHDTLLFFTDKGKVFSTKAWEIADSTRQSKGQALVNIIDLDQEEKILSVCPMGEDIKGANLIIATKHGVIKKTALAKFDNLRSSGLIAIRLRSSDALVSVRQTTGSDHILLITRLGKSIRFPESNVRPMGRATTGVKGITLAANDEVIAMMTFDPAKPPTTDGRRKAFTDILTISEKGLGKRTRIDLFPVQKRTGKGVKAAVVNAKTGDLAAAIMVTENDDKLVITSSSGVVIKVPVAKINQMGRSTQGVIIMRLKKAADKVAAIATLDKDEQQ